jgi:hypothetical protein
MLATFVDPTDARKQAAHRRPGGGERIMNIGHPTYCPARAPAPLGQCRIRASAVCSAAGGSGSGFPHLETVSENVP